MAVWKREAGTDGESQGYSIEVADIRRIEKLLRSGKLRKKEFVI